MRMHGFTQLGSFLNLRAKVEKAAKANDGRVMPVKGGSIICYHLEGYCIVVETAASGQTTLWQADSLTPLRTPNEGLREVEAILKDCLSQQAA